MTTGTASAKNQAVAPSTARRGTPAGGSPATSAKAAANRNRGSDADSLGLFLRDLDHHPLPDHDAQTQLAKRVAAGDDAARREMVAANLRLVVHWARRYQDRGVDLPDLIGLLDYLYRAREPHARLSNPMFRSTLAAE